MTSRALRSECESFTLDSRVSCDYLDWESWSHFLSQNMIYYANIYTGKWRLFSPHLLGPCSSCLESQHSRKSVFINLHLQMGQFLHAL